ncbi:hypothetical protein [Streptomyces atratus]|uniref:hypothetical protein n=1 Tax=Streptomyces atratus TaxID=1893 RepID=UPI003648FFA9
MSRDPAGRSQPIDRTSADPQPESLDHEVCLDEFALRPVKDWLVERHHRRPLSANPYLIVSPITAMHVDRPAVGISSFQALRGRIGIHFTRLRQDRFLDEAREPADPVLLMRLFGITSHTATSAPPAPNASPSTPPRREPY